MRRKQKLLSGRKSGVTLKNIQQDFFHTQIVLIVSLALFLGMVGTLINIQFENQKRDQNLQNVARTIAGSPVLDGEPMETAENRAVLQGYLDSLKDTLSDIDVISVVNTESVRLYHSNHELIGTVYDGTIPEFEYGVKEYYASNDQGPSGTQRRAYAAIYNAKGEYVGFVMAIMLQTNIRAEMFQTFFVFFLITVAAILMELMISSEMTGKIKESLLGYEPDVFSAMYKIRDNILESLDEGIIAIDGEQNIQFANRAAVELLCGAEHGDDSIAGKPLDSICNADLLRHTLETGEKEFNLPERSIDNADILIDRIPIKEEDRVVGAVGILHNRTEYTRLMEDLTGTRYLVDSMRANNHDFTNKLHVILGLIQMEMYEEAIAYIENISIVQRATISKIMNTVNEPAVAALLIGKVARASELNVKFVLREGCYYSNTAIPLPAEALVTIIGNLIDNAFDSMNERESATGEPKELLFGIYSRPGAVLITTDDTGKGIRKEDMEHIFENGYSTKGEGRGTGLYQVKMLVEGLGGTISVESQEGVGTSFSVSFTRSEQKE